MTPFTTWWRPDVFARRAERLRARARIKQAVRAYFLDCDVVEVETPVLQRSPGNETHIAAFRTEAIGDDGRRQPLYLHSSPEFACKTLLAAGVPRLFTMAPVFRNRERGRLHHPEFTMLEWYRTEPSLDALMEDCIAILRAAACAAAVLSYAASGMRPSSSLAQSSRPISPPLCGEGQGVGALAASSMETSGRAPRSGVNPHPCPFPTRGNGTPASSLPTEEAQPVLRYRGVEADPFAEPEILLVTEAFRRHAGVDLAAMLPDAPGAFDRLASAARSLGQRVSSDDTWSDLFSKILSARVEPALGIGRPTFLTRYPASEAALARLCPDDPRFAERFELYCCGVELANAFDELTDPAEQRRRFEQAEAERQRIYGETYPLDEDFLAALAHMPHAVGIALGFDRLVMLATGAEQIEDVLWAPVAESAS